MLGFACISGGSYITTASFYSRAVRHAAHNFEGSKMILREYITLKFFTECICLSVFSTQALE